MTAEATGLKSFLQKFTVLKTAPRELWVIYIQKIIETAAYGMMSFTLVLYLSKDLGFGDLSAGTVIGLWSTGITLATLFVGSLTDAIGIRRSFLLGFVICLLSRAVMTFVSNPTIVMLLGFTPLAVGLALMVPVMAAGVRRYTNQAQRSIAFAIFYTLMNVGFVIGSWLFDAFRSWLGEQGTYVVPLLGMTLTTYRTIFLFATLLTFAGLLVVLFFLREGVEMSEHGDEIKVGVEKKAENPFRIFGEVVGEKAFWRFMLFLLLLVGVRLVFYHMHYTFPKYAIREIGEGAKIGTVWGMLNGGIIVALVPLIGALAQRVPSFTMMVVGSIVAASPVFLLALPGAWFQGWADLLGALTGVSIHPLYIPVVIFVVIFSIGEAIWSPRLYEYTASIAPKGREGSYMALSLLPLFLAKLVVGPMSGWLLQEYCPEQGPRQPWIMWLLIAAMAAATPISIVLLRNVIRPPEVREPALARAPT